MKLIFFFYTQNDGNFVSIELFFLLVVSGNSFSFMPGFITVNFSFLCSKTGVKSVILQSGVFKGHNMLKIIILVLRDVKNAAGSISFLHKLG